MAYIELKIRKVSPPTLVQTQVEGGYNSEAFLTQFSQLYLETYFPFMGNVFCIGESFRADKSPIRRRFSEFALVKAELNSITFDDLLSHIEPTICRIPDPVFNDPMADAHIMNLNLIFQVEASFPSQSPGTKVRIGRF
jgi:asparaginyl-tRNA synthetase